MVSFAALMGIGTWAWHDGLGRRGADQFLQTSTRKWGASKGDASGALILDWKMASSANLHVMPALASHIAKTEIILKVSGTLVLTQLPTHSPDDIAIHVRLDAPRVEVTSNMGAQQESISDALNRGVFLRLNSLGHVMEIAVATAGDTEALALWRSLWGDLQLRLPDSKVTSEWEVQESDAKGSYVAQYDRVHDSIRKTKVRYLTDSQRKALNPDYRITSHLDATWEWPADAPWPQSLTLTESYKTTIEGQEVASGETTINLSTVPVTTTPTSAKERGALAEAFGRARRAGQTDDLAGTKAWESLKNIHAKQQLGDHNDDTLAVAIAGDLARADNPQLSPTTYLALRARFLLDATAASAWMEKLKQWGSDDPRYMAVAETMAAAGTPACQTALADLIESERDNRIAAIRLLPALGMVDEPTDASVAFIKKLSEDGKYVARSSATLSLGAVGQRLRGRDPAAASLLYDELRERFGSSSGEDRGLMMAALGNLGDSRQVELVKPHLSTTETPLKVDAVRSLRFVDTNARDDLLIEVLTNNDVAEVRSAAAYALSFGSNTNVQAVQRERLKQERDAGVAQQMVHNLASNRHRSTENLEALRWVAEKHPDANTRQLAAGYLQTTPP